MVMLQEADPTRPNTLATRIPGKVAPLRSSRQPELAVIDPSFKRRKPALAYVVALRSRHRRPAPCRPIKSVRMAATVARRVSWLLRRNPLQLRERCTLRAPSKVYR